MVLGSATTWFNQNMLFGFSATFMVTLAILIINMFIIFSALRAGGRGAYISCLIISGLLWFVILINAGDNFVRSRQLEKDHSAYLLGLSPDVWGFVFLVLALAIAIPSVCFSLYFAKRAETKYKNRYRSERNRATMLDKSIREHKLAMVTEKDLRASYPEHFSSPSPEMKNFIDMLDKTRGDMATYDNVLEYNDSYVSTVNNMETFLRTTTK